MLYGISPILIVAAALGVSDGQIPEIHAETGNGSAPLIAPPEEMDPGARCQMANDPLSQPAQCVRENSPVGGSANVPHPPILIAFDGINQLGREASRQRLLSEKLTYTLTVDEQGNPTNCELSRDFRRRATEIALCRPLLRHSRFEPARDENGNPVEGTYGMTVDFDMWMGQDGFLEPEDRD